MEIGILAGVYNWIQITALSYLAAALLSWKGSAIIPWWLCGIMVGACYGANLCLASSSFKGYKIIILNAISYLVFCVIPISFYKYWIIGRMWPEILPGIIIILIVWSALVYSFLNSPADDTKVMLWEIAIAAGTYGMFLSYHYGLNIPCVSLIPLFIISSGLLNQGEKRRAEYPGAIRTNKVSNQNSHLNLVFILAGIITVFGVLGLALQRLVQDSWLAFLKRVVDWFNSLRHPVESKRNPIIDEILRLSQEQFTTVTWSGSETSTPLWFMILLWFILALILLVGLIIVSSKIKEYIISLKAIRDNLPAFNRTESIKKNLLAMILRSIFEYLSSLYYLIRKGLSWFKRILVYSIGIPPANFKELFSYYIWWGSYIGLKKYNNETPWEYLKRLRIVFEKDHPELTASLSQLTLAHEKYCYGGSACSLSEQEIKGVFSVLVRYKCLKQKTNKNKHNLLRLLKLHFNAHLS